jgi:hypothetical protein
VLLSRKSLFVIKLLMCGACSPAGGDYPVCNHQLGWGGALSADVQSNTFVAFSLSFKLNSEVRKFVISLPW